MNKVFLATRKFLSDEEGATIIEYALMVALIAVAAIVIITAVGNNVKAAFHDICVALKPSGSGVDCP